MRCNLVKFTICFYIKCIFKICSDILRVSKTPKPSDVSLDVRLKSPNLSLLLTVKDLTLAPNNPLIPVTFARISVVKLPITYTRVYNYCICKNSILITGLTIAPTPPPVDDIVNSGNELYSLP